MKKNYLILLLAVCICSTAFGQLQRGNVLVGGEISNFRFDLGEGKNFSMTINPKAAWFIQDNFAAGPYLNFGLSTAKGLGTDINYGLGIFSRYYVNREQVNLLRHTRLFFEGNVGIEGFNPDQGDNTNGLGLGIGPGIAYFITPNIGLEALVKYNGIVGFGSSPTSNLLNLGIGFQIYLPSTRIKERLKDSNK